jgi:hypothetical protein
MRTFKKTINNNRITITAASDAMKVSAKAWVVTAAPAKAEERLGRVCERTICGWFELIDPYVHFLCKPILGQDN